MQNTLPPDVAFDLAAGRVRDPNDVSPGSYLTEEHVALAKSILSARSTGLEEEPCPQSVLHRVRGVFVTQKVPRLAQLVTARGAARGSGSGKFLRYEVDERALDILIRIDERDTLQMYVAVDEDIARVSVRDRDGRRDVELDEFGTGTIACRECEVGLTVHTYDKTGAEVFQTPWISLE